MKVTLSPSYELTTEHPSSSYGQPVLVKRGTGEAFGPGDIIKAFPSFGFMPAALVVRRLAKRIIIDEENSDIIERFIGGMK